MKTRTQEHVAARLLLIAMIAASTWLASSPARAQAAPKRIDLSKLGPQVGERVPDFSLPDQTGKTQTLQSITGPRGAMLVFIRSADW